MRTRELLKAARELGAQAGRNAAEWTHDGNTPDEWYGRTLDGIRDGDPEALDAFNEPSLSGEWADDEDSVSLIARLGVNELDPRLDWLADELCTAWEEAASQAFWDGIERACADHVAKIGGRA